MINTQALGEALKKSKGCGTRFGCWICTVVAEDASMTNMLKKPQYAYMRGLARLRNFLVATQYDLSRRDWVGKTIDKDGYIRIRPDTYSPQMLEDILKYTISIQYEECIASVSEGLDRPRFTVFSPEQIIAIDALWSLNGIHRPFHALKILKEIWWDGKTVEIPQVHPSPKVPFPDPKYYYAGTEWYENEHAYLGLRDPIMETFGAGGCHTPLKELANGKTVIDVGTEAPFTVNGEELPFFLEYEAPNLIDQYHDNLRYGFPTAYCYYLRTGILSVNKSQLSRIDMILRRTAYKEGHNLNGAPDPVVILEKSVTREPIGQTPRLTEKQQHQGRQDMLPLFEQAA